MARGEEIPNRTDSGLHGANRTVLFAERRVMKTHRTQKECRAIPVVRKVTDGTTSVFHVPHLKTILRIRSGNGEAMMENVVLILIRATQLRVMLHHATKEHRATPTVRKVADRTTSVFHATFPGTTRRIRSGNGEAMMEDAVLILIRATQLRVMLHHATREHLATPTVRKVADETMRSFPVDTKR